MEEQVNDDDRNDSQILCQEIQLHKNSQKVNANNSLNHNQLNLLEDSDVIKEETHHGEESHQTTGKTTGGKQQSSSQDEGAKQTPTTKNPCGDGKLAKAHIKLDDSMNLLLSCSQQSLINPTRSI